MDFLRFTRILTLLNSMNSSSKSRASNGVVGLPYHASHGSDCQLRGQNCYVEISFGCPVAANGRMLQRCSSSHKNFSRHTIGESPAETKMNQKGSLDQSRIFIYPAEAVLVPVMQTSFARSSLKRYVLLSQRLVDLRMW